MKELSVYLMSAFYIFAGISHFKNPDFFLKIIPPWVPWSIKTNLLVGAIEIVLGLGLTLNVTKHYAAWGIIVLLIAVFPANVYHFLESYRKEQYVLATLLRLPVQGLLIYWAYSLSGQSN